MRRMLFSQRPLIICSRFNSQWAGVALAPPDKILGLTESFKADKCAQKINLGVGAYRDDDGKPLVLSSVRAAELRMSEKSMDKEYAPIAGVQSFIQHALEFGYGSASEPLASKRVAAVQTISGTGGCRLAGEFIKKFVGSGSNKKIFVPSPTWGNHINIFKDSGLLPTYYPYYDSKTKAVDFSAMMDFVKKEEKGSVFMLHACAHNPTGCDPSQLQWQELSQLMKERNHVVFFDSAYQGFASGDPEADAFSLRQFVNDGHQIMLCQSFAKNFGLYGERAGVLSVVTASPEEAERVNSQLKVIIRPMYSNPPLHGARIVAEILGDPALKQKWLLECQAMAKRIGEMRVLLRQKLEAGNVAHRWNHITDQIGMFCFTGLNQEQVKVLREKYHIYCTDDGRFSMAGINKHNIDYLAQSVLAVL